jgi:hypothetical protein
MLGLVATVVFLLAFPVKGGGAAMGLDLTIATTPTGEFQVEPIGPFLRGAGLTPGEDAKGTLDVRNQTASTLSVGINVMASTNYSDDILEITATHDGTVILQGALGDLRGMNEDLFTLSSGETAEIDVTAKVMANASDYKGRVEDVTFELHAGAGQ